MKSVQIPEELFWQLCRYHLGDPLDSEEAVEVLQEIDNGLQTKLEAMQRRLLYSMYKDTKATPEARQEARKAYLDMKAMLPEYRWQGLEPPI